MAFIATEPRAGRHKRHPNCRPYKQLLFGDIEIKKKTNLELWRELERADVRGWKQFHLFRTPPILIIHLKRFHYSASTHRRDKIDVFIDFPLIGLDLTPAEVMYWSEDEKPVYGCNHYLWGFMRRPLYGICFE